MKITTNSAENLEMLTLLQEGHLALQGFDGNVWEKMGGANGRIIKYTNFRGVGWSCLRGENDKYSESYYFDKRWG